MPTQRGDMPVVMTLGIGWPDVNSRKPRHDLTFSFGTRVSSSPCVIAVGFFIAAVYVFMERE